MSKKKKGEQMTLIDVGPENLKAIVKEVRLYKKHQSARLAALKKETELKEKIRALVKEAKLQRLSDGTIKFEADQAVICVAPQDDLITIKDKKKGMKKKIETEEAEFEKDKKE